MNSVEVRDMDPSDEYFVSTCTHENESDEIDASARRRLAWLRSREPDAVPPRMLTSAYEFEPVPGKVVVDLFWHTFCETCDIEATRVREVAAEFGDRVVLREYCGDDRDTLLKHQIPRAIYVQGNEIGWGYEAPRDGIRSAINAALERADTGEA